ncbi:TetR/AcrR family transcriptional regulator [Streptomyces griseocarneus]|uniref:TetR/AcrR family transcriptional regulator n=1 Tax=Streptomyces griseocarneus TaxID=51201 RepID=UPI00167E484C|nr:TetR/AcrR family transcriptional regulator [Streptomyces griseocarneus]MBZ6472671.1 TetR/AcrR family transcriptional regulator [Streptomyces griseocarneus]GHG46638.1 TetR family transcriptional regulator [Streptomyces griseocarneus]
MPKIVDPEARRRAVADAVFRVARRDGLENASLRNVAEEAGLAVGSVRHYFAGHSELMLFAMRELARRVESRVRGRAERLLASPSGPDRAALVEELLAEFLPLDAARHDEAVLWLAFTTAARVRPELRPRADELHAGMRELLDRVLGEGRRAGGFPEDLDVPVETLRLLALLDGLTLTAVLQPGHVTADDMRRVLRLHLRSLKGV